MSFSLSARLLVFVFRWCLPLLGIALICAGWRSSHAGFVASAWLGGAIIGLGLIPAAMAYRRLRQARHLRTHGLIYWAEFAGIEINPQINISGQCPVRIVAHWQHPRTLETLEFLSPNFWFDPSPYVKEKVITVYVDKDRSGRYHMELDFLPRLSWIV